MPKKDDQDGLTPEREPQREPERKREPEAEIVRSSLRQPRRLPSTGASSESERPDQEGPILERESSEREPERASSPTRPVQRPQSRIVPAKPVHRERARRETLTFQKGWWQTVAGSILALAAIVLLSGVDEKKPAPPLLPPANAESIPDEIVVDLMDSATDADIAALGQAFRIQLRYNSIHSHTSKLMVAKVPPLQRAQILAALRQHVLVEAAEPQWLYRAFYDGSHPPNDPGYAKQWHFRAIGMEEAWKVTRGQGVVVAVIDTGVAAANVGLWRQAQDLRQTTFLKGYDFVNKDEYPEDDVRHGTHVASTIAESTNNNILGAGVAPAATILPVKVLATRAGKEADVAEGIRFAADHGAKVINLSLGNKAYSSILKASCDYAYNKGVTLICAAGNDGEQGGGGVGYPARYEMCIAVSAVGPQENLAPYSDWGDEIDIAAPGGDLSQGDEAGVWQNTVVPTRRGLVDDFIPLNGTSMAAPHVAGVAALLVSLGVQEPAEVRSILRKTAKPKSPSEQYGAGLLDAAAAVKLASQGGRQFSRRWGLAAILSLVGLAIALGRWKELGQGASLLQFALPLAIGLCAPDVLEFVFGFGSRLNMLSHSVLIPIMWLNLPNLKRTSLRWALAVTVGLVVHLLMDAHSGATPFAVLPQWRVSLWLYTNAAVGAMLLFFAFQETSTERREVKKSAAAA